MISTSNPELAAEAALVERARTDAGAFGELYDRYLSRVYRYMYARCGAHADAEDLTAETFHRALERLETFEWRGVPFAAWLFRIAHNRLVDWYRRRPRSASLDALQEQGVEPKAGWNGPEMITLATGTAEGGVEQQVIQQEEIDATWVAVAELPPMQRRAVTLYFARGLSHAEVGRTIGRSEPATKQLVYRAMKTLRSQLAAQEGGDTNA